EKSGMPVTPAAAGRRAAQLEPPAPIPAVMQARRVRVARAAAAVPATWGKAVTARVRRGAMVVVPAAARAPTTARPVTVERAKRAREATRVLRRSWRVPPIRTLSGQP